MDEGTKEGLTVAGLGCGGFIVAMVAFCTGMLVVAYCIVRVVSAAWHAGGG